MKSHWFSTFLPVRKYTISTALSQDEVGQRLYQVTDPSRKKISIPVPTFPQFKKDISTYTGTISKTEFKISRNISYRNSLLPVIEGKIDPFPDKTEIRISMRLHIFVRVFMTIWLSLAGIASIVMLSLMVIALVHFNALKPEMLIPVGMFFFGYLLTFFAFKYEAKRSKAELNILFEATSSHVD